MKNNIRKEIIRRLKIITGHLGRVAKMVEEEKYCIDILQQSLAVQSALKEVDNIILDSHLRTCVANAFKKGGNKEKVVKELLTILKRNKR